MQARFLLGPAGSGKTFRCLAEIRDALRSLPEGAPLILIAPKQATFQLERQLLGWGERPREPKLNSADGSSEASPHQINGFARLQILSFERLARFIFEKLSVAPPEFLSDEGRVMILRALLLRRENELKLFRRSARRPGFAQEISRLLNEFQQHQLSPAKLRALAGNKNLRGELRDKLLDLALLHENYSGWLAENKLQDANRFLDFATVALRDETKIQNSKFKIENLWLDGFAEMTPQELNLLAAVLPFCENAALAFCLDESGAKIGEVKNSWLSIWNTVGKTFQQCRQRIENLPDSKIEIEILPRDSQKNRFAKKLELARLEKKMAQISRTTGELEIQDSKLKISVCANPESEAVFAAREILKFVRAGNRFRDCAVLVRNLDHFHKPFSRTFRRYGIPFFLDRRESVAHHPLAELTRSTLRTVALDWLHDDWFAALKAGFCPADETEIDRLENESLARGWRGKKWREPVQIADNPELENFLERLRQKIIPPFENFHKQLAELKFQPNGKQLSEILRGLWSDLKVEQRLQNWSDHSIYDSRFTIHATIWEQMNSWLDNVELAFPDEQIALRDWLPILESGLANLTVGVIPPALDEVLIGAIDRARNPDLKFALVSGVNETIFPAAPNPPAILTDADRDELNQILSLGPDLRERLARERYYGYVAFTRASEKLAITFSRHDANGKALNPSPFIGQLQSFFPKIEVENFDGQIELNEIESANELIPSLVEIQNSKLKNQNWNGLLEIPALAELTKDLSALREPNPAENLSPAIAEKFYGVILKTSVSRLEEFAQCPFKFFVRFGLRAEERKIFELDARERGSFQHDVLKIFHEQLVVEKKRWRDLTPQAARERIGKIAAELAENFREGLFGNSPQTKFAARAMAESLQNFVEVAVAWMREQYEFDPAAVELDFGWENSRAPAWEIDLAGGRKLALRGRIDRIDLCRQPDDKNALAIILDYKSSAKKLDAVLVENGVQLQLLAYLSALRRWKNPRGLFGVEKLIPAGVFYVNLRGQFGNGKTRGEVLTGTNESRRAAYRHTGRFDAGILEKLDSIGAADQFNFARNQDGSLRKGLAEALPRAEFEKLLDHVEMQLREMGNAIFSGTAQVDPYRKGRETPCEFCDYRAACRIDPWTHHFRTLNAKTVSTE